MKKICAKTGIAAFTVAALLALGGCSSESSDSQSQSNTAGAEGSQSVTVGLTYIPSVQFAPVYVAEDSGIFGEYDIDATIRHHGSDEALFTALQQGEEDITVASADEVLQARSQGLDLVSVGAFYHEYPVSVLVRADSGIETMADLAGHSIGVPVEYGSSWFGLLAALEDADLTTDDVDIQLIGYTQASALATSQVDAVVGFVNSDQIQLEQMGIEVVNLTSDMDWPLIAASLVTTREFAEENPELLTDVVSAITEGVQATIDDPETALEVTTNYDETLVNEETLSNAQAILTATIELWKSADGRADATQDLELWQQMGEFLSPILEFSLEEVEIEQAVTNDFVV